MIKEVKLDELTTFDKSKPAPGSLVSHEHDRNASGIIVGIIDEQAHVAWSKEPINSIWAKDKFYDRFIYDETYK